MYNMYETCNMCNVYDKCLCIYIYIYMQNRMEWNKMQWKDENRIDTIDGWIDRQTDRQIQIDR